MCQFSESFSDLDSIWIYAIINQQAWQVAVCGVYLNMTKTMIDCHGRTNKKGIHNLIYEFGFKRLHQLSRLLNELVRVFGHKLLLTAVTGPCGRKLHPRN